MLLRPQTEGNCFQICEASEDKICGLAFLIFTNDGKPRLGCMKESLESLADTIKSKKPFFVYHGIGASSANGRVPILAIDDHAKGDTLLLDTKLKNEFSIALWYTSLCKDTVPGRRF
uniref:Uncharacterized protein n=1 Tax=Grammatophora oceanica TaxID=210454 RepID=A0A7S1UWF4_9STRA|mmetsp:Transcript_23178/g.34329  ORF Transcript_23178/g.34329 Transcript_23178/m.34329 type:complete len:117 (+) Transcript_23178:456-806(+)